MATAPQDGGRDIRIPLAITPDNRDASTSKDARIVNAYVETGTRQGEVRVYKRAGVAHNSQPTGGSATGKGLYNWLGDIYSVFNGTLYKNGGSVHAVDSTNGVYRFNQTQATKPQLVLSNGAYAYSWDNTTFTQIQQGGPVVNAGSFVVGVTYQIVTLGNTDWGVIGAKTPAVVGEFFTASGVGSGTGTAQTDVVTAGNFTVGVLYKILTVGTTTNWASIGAATPAIVGETFIATGAGAGDGTATVASFPAPNTFAKQLVWLDGGMYVLKFDAHIIGSDFLQILYWDATTAGNVIEAQIEPDGGVALAKQLVYVIALKQWTTEVFYDAGNTTGSPLGPVQGAKIAYGCAHQDSVQSVDDTLLWLATNRSTSLQVAALDNLKLVIVSTKPIERLLDGITIDPLTYGNVISFTYKEGGHTFYVLTIKSANLTLVYDLKERAWSQWTDPSGNYFPFVANTFNASGQELWQHESDGWIYTPDPSNYTDQGKLIPVNIYTPNWDAGTDKRKNLGRLFFSGDKTPGSKLTVRCSDDDYQTWSNPREVDMSRTRPYLDKCGSFYRRAWHISHADATPMRLFALEPIIELGTV